MQILNAALIPAEPLSDPNFVGGTVTRQTLVGPAKERTLSAFLVNFSRGAHNTPHRHTSDQILIVTAGQGIVSSEQEERVVGLGDIILFPAGEKHWHGATKDSSFSHIYVMSAGYKTTVIRK